MLFRTICRTGIFMICAQAIVHFRPRESYEKYLKLLVGAMVLIQLFLPLANLFAGGNLQDAAAQLEQFQKELEEAMEEAQAAAVSSAGMLEQMTLDEVRKRAQEQQAQGRDGAGPGQETTGPWQTGNSPEQEEAGQEQGEIPQGESTPENGESPGITVEVAPVEPVQIQIE